MTNVCEYRWHGIYHLPPVVPTEHVCLRSSGHVFAHECHCGATTDVSRVEQFADPDLIRPPAKAAVVLPNPPFVCGWKPTGLKPNEIRAALDGCPMCGHAVLAHMGEDACVVCLLVRMATPEWQRQQARIHGGRWPY